MSRPLILIRTMTLRSLAGLTMVVAGAAITACGTTQTTTSAPAPTTSAPATNTAAARPANAMPSNVTPAMIAMGDSIYHARGCRNCHGMDGKGSGRGPDLTDAALLHVDGSFDDYVRIITVGVPADAIKEKTRTAAMRPRGGPPAPLTDEQIRTVAAYVLTLRK